MKTSELTGAALDFAVEIANNPELEWGVSIGLHWASNTIVNPALNEPDCYRHPSSNWAQGGPIIEQEQITVRFWRNESFCTAYLNSDNAEWAMGGTPLEAAMRCYVASKLGDEVDIPKELT